MWIVLLAAAPASAWEPVGHEAAALIAQRRLTPAALDAVRTILGPSAGGRALDLVDVAGCPDGFAHEPNFRCAKTFELQGAGAASAPWHFINIPISAKDPQPKDYCSSKGCLWSQLQEDERVLRDGAASPQARRTALVFLVHLMGDAHQPLHCADDGDLGGNKKPVDVELGGQKLNLHKVWDEALMPPSDVDWRLPSDKLSAQANMLAADLERELAAIDPKQVEDWRRGDLTTVSILESWRIAKDEVYPQYAKDQGIIANPMRDAVGTEYRGRMMPIVRRRLEMAGVRTAELLNRIFAR